MGSVVEAVTSFVSSGTKAFGKISKFWVKYSSWFSFI